MTPPPERGHELCSRRALWWLAALVVLLALVYTNPLWRNLDRAIPHSYAPPPGYERMPLMPGDHLQFYYWSWLMVDNLAGPSRLFSNPYEFNTYLGSGPKVYANFPFSLIYAALYPLGAVRAYNLMVLLTYLLAGVCAFLLAREMLGHWLAALPAGLIFALLPFRTAQLLSGHLYGFVAFLLPLWLWCLERGLRRRSLAWGIASGGCLVVISLMEGHLIYYSVLLLALYLPLRLLLLAPPPLAESEGGQPHYRAALWPVLAGLGLGFTVHLAMSRHAGTPLFSSELAVSCLAYLIFTLCGWLLLSHLAASLTSLSPEDSRRLLAKGVAPLALSPLYVIQFWLDVPHLGSLLMGFLLLWGAWRVLPGLWRARRRPALEPSLLRPLLPLVVGVAASAGYMLWYKSRAISGSIAGGGRSLHEVKLFAPHLPDLFDPANIHTERLLYLGWVLGGLCLAGLVLLALKRGARNPGDRLAAMWAALGALAVLLSLGPNFAPAPLYQWLYHHLPFFNFPRVPGRLIVIAALMLSLLAGWALLELGRRLQRRWGRRTLPALALLLVAAVTWDLWPPRTTGLCLIPPPGKMEKLVKRNLPTGPGAPRRLAGIPIWPGDSHQSSFYEFISSRTRAVCINGYSPVVPRAYVQQIYTPLSDLNYGLVSPRAREALRKNAVGLLAFVDDDQVYARKVCPWPPALARKRLLASPFFRPLGRAGNVFFLRPLLDAGQVPTPPAALASSPVTSLWEAEWLKHGTGRLVDDPHASGWGLMFAEPKSPTAPLGLRLPRWVGKGNLVQARAGRDRPAYLCFGPYKMFPPGRFVARFRLRRGPGKPPGYVDVAVDQGRRILARRELTPQVLPADGRWHDVTLSFQLDKVEVLELRTYFSGGSDLAQDLVLVDFADTPQGPGWFAAADLWRQAGRLQADPRVPGGLAVRARRDWTPPLYLMHGPQRTLEPGRYLARFRLAAAGPAPAEAPVAEMVVATDLGRITLGHRLAKAGELSKDYRWLEVPFTVPRRLEVGLRVRYRQGGDLLLAGAELRRLP